MKYKQVMELVPRDAIIGADTNARNFFFFTARKMADEHVGVDDNTGLSLDYDARDAYIDNLDISEVTARFDRILNKYCTGDTLFGRDIESVVAEQEAIRTNISDANILVELAIYMHESDDDAVTHDHDSDTERTAVYR